MGINLNITKNTTLELTPTELAVVVNAVMKLPYQEVRQLMDNIEAQLVKQHSPVFNGPTADQSAAPN